MKEFFDEKTLSFNVDINCLNNPPVQVQLSDPRMTRFYYAQSSHDELRKPISFLSNIDATSRQTHLVLNRRVSC